MRLGLIDEIGTLPEYKHKHFPNNQLNTQIYERPTMSSSWDQEDHDTLARIMNLASIQGGVLLSA